MSLHDELMASGVELLAEVQGSGTFTLTPPVGEAMVMDVLMRGGISVADEDMLARRDMAEERIVEKLTIKVPGLYRGESFTPPLSGSGQLAGDGEPWEIEGYSGAGSAVVTIMLKRVRIASQGRAGRYHGSRR